MTANTSPARVNLARLRRHRRQQQQQQQQQTEAPMATTLAGVSVSTARAAPAAGPTRPPATAPRAAFPSVISFPRRAAGYPAAGRLGFARTAASGPTTPSDISDKVSESIKKAEEMCAGDPVSGECVAAWDEVEELSAAASHARDKLKASDPLESYCQDNPETNECRTYED